MSEPREVFGRRRHPLGGEFGTIPADACVAGDGREAQIVAATASPHGPVSLTVCDRYRQSPETAPTVAASSASIAAPGSLPSVAAFLYGLAGPRR